MTDPRTVEAWAERLAEVAAPDEIDIAPETAAAYLAGGTARRELFAGARADPGAFGGGLVLAMPAILDALAQSALAVRVFLADPAVSSSIASASLLVAFRQLRRPSPAEPAGPEPEPSDPLPPPEVVERAEASVEALAARLAESVATAERAEAMAREVLTVLARDPLGAVHFLDLIRGPGRG
jgi:hypothetical protein